MQVFGAIKRVGGAPGRIRTPDPLIRSQVLYPAELPVHEGDLRRGVRRCKYEIQSTLPDQKNHSVAKC